MLDVVRKAVIKVKHALGVANGIKQDTEFGRRIRHRHSAFWDPADAEEVRNTHMQASDPLSKWKDTENWQRKLSNKYNAREFARMHGCRVPDLYWKGRDCSQLDFGSLPSHYVIRPTIGHSCECVFLMADALNLMDKQTYTSEEIRERLNQETQKNPRVEFLVEEFVKTERGEYRIPNDYKFYMFNGHLAFVQVINRVGAHTGFTSFYSGDWKQLQNINTIYKAADPQEKPRSFDEMHASAIRLGQAYEIFVRVDFYDTDKGAVFGEFTPTPGMGAAFTDFGNQLLIDGWDTHCKGRI